VLSGGPNPPKRPGNAGDTRQPRRRHHHAFPLRNAMIRCRSRASSHPGGRGFESPSSISRTRAVEPRKAPRAMRGLSPNRSGSQAGVKSCLSAVASERSHSRDAIASARLAVTLARRPEQARGGRALGRSHPGESSRGCVAAASPVRAEAGPARHPASGDEQVDRRPVRAALLARLHRHRSDQAVAAGSCGEQQPRRECRLGDIGAASSQRCGLLL
jgi:hypothetical protein